MPYAANGKISHDIIEGGIEITDDQYAQGLAGLLSGLVVTIDGGFNVLPPPETAKAPEKTLDELKAEKNAEINASRMGANYSTFTHGGKLFSCDALSRSDIDGTANHIALFGTFPPDFPGAWKAVDNTIVPMQSTDDFKALYQSMTAAGAANFNKSQALKAQLAQATTAEQVAAIVW